MRAAILALTLLAIGAAPALADAIDCDRNDQSQLGMNMCAAADAAKSDALLNQLYKKLAAKAEDKERTALRDAQRAWIAFRDKECTYETVGEEGGSIRPMEYSLCVKARTDDRIKDFRKFLECAPSDLSCPAK